MLVTQALPKIILRNVGKELQYFQSGERDSGKIILKGINGFALRSILLRLAATYQEGMSILRLELGSRIAPTFCAGFFF